MRFLGPLHYCKHLGLTFYCVLFIFLFLNSVPANAQTNNTVFEVTKKEDLNFLKPLVALGKQITEGRKTCKESAKDYKQECVCDKSKDFFALEEMIREGYNRPEWFQAVLVYDDAGQAVRTSLRYFQDINNQFNLECVANDDGTFRAHHEWDKPELTVKDSEEIKQLQFIKDRHKKMQGAVIECQSTGMNSSEACACSYKDDFKLIGLRIKNLLKDRQELYNHILIYRYDGGTTKTSLEEVIRMIRYNISQCKK